MKKRVVSGIKGLTTTEALEKQRKFGKNVLTSTERNHLWESLKHIALEPMFLLLAVACTLYFILGDLAEAVMMLVSIAFVAGIEVYQETKSEKALEALRRYTEAQVRVLRDGAWTLLPAEELVPGDVVEAGEGDHIPADGIVLEQHDLSVDESILTGESLAVDKNVKEGHNLLYQGTTVASGSGVFRVSTIGNNTELGKLGKSIEQIDPPATPLQLQLERFVKQIGLFGILAFALVFFLNLALSHDFWMAILFSLTIAMALLPEEIPVAFTTFMALGSYRMIKMGILAKQPKTVESLGAATVICLDKTGTITENKMSVAELRDLEGVAHPAVAQRILEYAWWASEPKPFDAMEKAIAERMNSTGGDPRHGYRLIEEYPLSGKPPMMTHIWQNAKGQRVIACKGALERVLDVCQIEDRRRARVLEHMEELAEHGHRVLGVASTTLDEGLPYPENQDDFNWQFEGIVAFYDPPKANIESVLGQFYEAGIRVLMITGDHLSTARNIARKVGLKGWEIAMTGHEAMQLDEKALKDAVQRVNVFARMFPDAKLRVVEALKSNGETVAMSGDGVNDGPALKAAQIGVAMGEKGSDLAKRAASLVLLQDDLSLMATAVGMGRRIYDNLRKAIRYIISIHVPIIVAVLAPLLLGWKYPHIFLPLHVIFLELVMDPMAAIGFENEPSESNAMQKKPRSNSTALFTRSELLLSVFQGLVIGAAVLYAFRFSEQRGDPENMVRTFVFTTLVLANLFLTLAIRSFEDSFFKTILYKNRFIWRILGVSLAMLGAVLYVPPVAGLFKLTPLSPQDFAWCLLFAFISVAWFEVVKIIKNKT